MRARVLLLPALAAVLLPGWGTPGPVPWYAQPPVHAAPPAEGAAGILGDTWWKLKVSAKGVQVSTADGSVTPGNFKTTAYMHLLPAPPDGTGPTYIYEMWTQTGVGVYSFEFGDTFPVDGLDKQGNPALEVNCFMGFDLLTQAVAANHSGRLSIKVDKNGLLKGAKIKTLSGEVQDSTLQQTVKGDDPPFYGSMKITGTIIDPTELPFTPP